MPRYMVRYLNIIADSPEDALNQTEYSCTDKVEVVSEKGTVYRFDELLEPHLFNAQSTSPLRCSHSDHGTHVVYH